LQRRPVDLKVRFPVRVGMRFALASGMPSVNVTENGGTSEAGISQKSCAYNRLKRVSDPAQARADETFA
jgi:hypothetical protein